MKTAILFLLAWLFAAPAFAQIGVAGASSPYSPPGAMTLISTQIASSSAFLAFTAIPSTFNTVLVKCDGLVVGTNNVGILLQYGEGATPTWNTSNYRYAGTAYNSTAGATSPSSTSASGISLNTLGINATFSFSTTIAVFMVPAGGFKNMTWHSVYANANDGPSSTFMTGSGTYTGDTGVITSLRFIPASGNIASGQCSLYGLSS